MALGQDEMDAAALDWAIRTGEPGFAEWEAFAAWLDTTVPAEMRKKITPE